MDTERVAMIFGHPGHELTVIGMLRRLRPRVLFVTQADSGGESDREGLGGFALDECGLADRADYLSLSEVESYERLFRGDLQWYRDCASRICDWLRKVRPTALFVDAFEFYNIHHDLCSAMVTAALRDLGLRCDRYDVPLACEGSADSIAKSYAQFDEAGWGYEYFELAAEEAQFKRRLLGRVAERVPYFKELLEAAAPDRWQREPFRRVGGERDYGTPARTFGWPTWEEWGRKRVEEGKYERPLLFKEHFLPVARSLGVATRPPRR